MKSKTKYFEIRFSIWPKAASSVIFLPKLVFTFSILLFAFSISCSSVNKGDIESSNNKKAKAFHEVKFKKDSYYIQASEKIGLSGLYVEGMLQKTTEVFLRGSGHYQANPKSDLLATQRANAVKEFLLLFGHHEDKIQFKRADVDGPDRVDIFVK